MEVTLLGTGDTTGTPTVGCDCETCLLARERGVERTRFSVHIKAADGTSLLIDASPDFRQQFLTHEVELPDAMIITHVHFDHLDGLGNTFRVLRELPIYASEASDPVMEESIAETVGRKYGYLDALSVHAIPPFEPFTIGSLRCRLLPVEHPPLLCYGLHIEDPATGGQLGITGDTNFDIPDATKEVLSKVDLLLADAIAPASYCDGKPETAAHLDANGTPRTFATKHMTREGALALAEDLEPAQLRLVHISHFYPASEAFEEPLAVDGERYQL